MNETVIDCGRKRERERERDCWLLSKDIDIANLLNIKTVKVSVLSQRGVEDVQSGYKVFR